MVAHILIPATPEVEIERLQSESNPGKSLEPYSKNKLKVKGLVCVTHVVEGLPSKLCVLSSIPAPSKNNC
jgi:hypothetical protein